MSDTGPGQLPGGAGNMVPPAGWYADPYIYNGQRYWDGYQWTTHAAAAPQVSGFAPAPPVAPIGRRDGVSVAAFVTALVGVWPVSMVLGFVGLGRTSGGRRSGRRLAVASVDRKSVV